MADLNKMAARIVGQATDEAPRQAETQHVKAGRKGGQLGGKARAGKLSAEQRSEIARKAARARWST